MARNHDLSFGSISFEEPTPDPATVQPLDSPMGWKRAYEMVHRHYPNLSEDEVNSAAESMVGTEWALPPLAGPVAVRGAMTSV